MSNENPIFKKAVKRSKKLRLAITGPSGSGKTYTALAIATNLGGKVAFVDTEHGSASLYSDNFDFDTIDLDPPYHPDRFGEMIKAAAEAGYSVIVIDSLTHAWNGTGGMLDVVDSIAKRRYQGNTFAAWKDGTPIQTALIDNITGAPIHIIATMRSKQEYAMEQGANGKSAPRKVGMGAVQRDGFEYEFDVVFDMNIDHEAIVSKTRASVLTDKVFRKPGKDVARILTEWLHGEPAEPKVDYATEEDIKTLHALGESVFGNWKTGGGKGFLNEHIGRTSTKGMTLAEYQSLVGKLNAFLEDDDGTGSEPPESDLSRLNPENVSSFETVPSDDESAEQPAMFDTTPAREKVGA